MEWSSWRRTRLAMGWIRPEDGEPAAKETLASVALLAVGAALASLAGGLIIVVLLTAIRHLHGSAGVPWARGWWFVLVSLPAVLVESLIQRHRHRSRVDTLAISDDPDAASRPSGPRSV